MKKAVVKVGQKVMMTRTSLPATIIRLTATHAWVQEDREVWQDSFSSYPLRTLLNHVTI